MRPEETAASWKKAKRARRRGAGGLSVLISVLALCPALAASTDVKLKPGRYAVTITYEVQDQRQNELRRGTRCITPGDLGHPERIFDDNLTSPHPARDSCSVRNWKAARGKISYEADCGNRKVRVQGAVSGTEFSVVRRVWLKEGREAALKLMVRGRWTGDCAGGGKGTHP